MPAELYLNRGAFGHDYGSTLWPASTWYPFYVDPSGLLHITTSPASTIGGIASTVDVDIKTLGGSLVPYGPLPITGTVDITGLGGTLDVDIKTIGGSVVPAGPLPVNVMNTATITGTVSMSYPGTLDVDIKTLGGSLIPSGPLPVTGTVSVSQANIYGYDGANWDQIKTTEALAGGTIDTGLLAVGKVPPADPVEKIASFTAAASTYAVWTPAGGKRWNLTDFVISAKNATDVTLYDGTTSTKANFYFADNGGVVMDLQTPFISTGTSTPLTISLTASTLSITTSGYETT